MVLLRAREAPPDTHGGGMRVGTAPCTPFSFPASPRQNLPAGTAPHHEGVGLGSGGVNTATALGWSPRWRRKGRGLGSMRPARLGVASAQWHDARRGGRGGPTCVGGAVWCLVFWGGGGVLTGGQHWPSAALVDPCASATTHVHTHKRPVVAGTCLFIAGVPPPLPTWVTRGG